MKYRVLLPLCLDGVDYAVGKEIVLPFTEEHWYVKEALVRGMLEKIPDPTEPVIGKVPPHPPPPPAPAPVPEEVRPPPTPEVPADDKRKKDKR